MSLVIGLLLVFGGLVFAFIQFAPCAFATSEAPFTGVIASAERWLQVTPPFPAEPESDGTARLDLSVREVGAGGFAGPTTTEPVAIDGSFMGDIRSALDEGSDVFLALASEISVREEVAYVIARTAEGEHAFIGGCTWTLKGSGLKEGLGPRYEAAIRQIIGLTDRDAIYRVLVGVREAPGRVLIEYDERPPDLRMFSRTGTLVERGRCLAVETDVGPLVPIVDDSYYLARDDAGLVLMSEMYKNVRPGDTVELAGREMSPDEALAVTDPASVRRCPGRLILITSISVTQDPPG